MNRLLIIVLLLNALPAFAEDTLFPQKQDTINEKQPVSKAGVFNPGVIVPGGELVIWGKRDPVIYRAVVCTWKPGGRTDTTPIDCAVSAPGDHCRRDWRLYAAGAPLPLDNLPHSIDNYNRGFLVFVKTRGGALP